MPMKKNMSPRARKPVDVSTYEGRFAVRLLMFREKTGLGAYEFAAKHGFARATVQSWENGTRTPTLGQLPEIAKALGISVRTLIPKE